MVERRVHEFGRDDARARIAVPGPDDDKYSRGVVGFVTGSSRYPGAAVLGVEAALRTGVGMVRYVGPPTPTRFVLARRPEVVAGPGRVQAWVLGSGQDAGERGERTRARLDAALASGTPIVVDGGALDLAADAARDRPVVVTPHPGELARLLGVARTDVAAAPLGNARRAAAELGAIVLLKGNETLAVTPAGDARAVIAPTTWLATAGTGDALAGILGALLATHAAELEDAHPLDALADLAATAAFLHGAAGARAAGPAPGGPFAVLDLCAELPATVRDLLR